MPLAPNLATLVAVGNGHLLEYIFPYLGCCDQLSLFSMARFIHIEARPVLLREPWIAFHCAVCSEVKRRFYDRCIRRAPKAFGWSWFLRHALHDGDSFGLNWNGASVQHISSPDLRNQVIRTCYIQSC